MNLVVRQSNVPALKTMLYDSTMVKLPSHSILPNSPGNVKFVIPATSEGECKHVKYEDLVVNVSDV